MHEPSSSPNGPPEADPPAVFDHKTAWDKADLTSLDWNQDGTLLAAGSYDAILRVCDASGQLYFSETMQKVAMTSNRVVFLLSLSGGEGAGICNTIFQVWAVLAYSQPGRHSVRLGCSKESYIFPV